MNKGDLCSIKLFYVDDWLPLFCSPDRANINQFCIIHHDEIIVFLEYVTNEEVKVLFGNYIGYLHVSVIEKIEDDR
jgi:hypothetical protein